MECPPSPLSSASSCSTATSALVVVRRRTAAKPRRDRQPMGGDFICATCMKAFPTMRALGGHQNAHRNKAVAEGEVQRPRKQTRGPAHAAPPTAPPAPVPAAPPAPAPAPAPAAQEPWRAAPNGGGILWQYPWERVAPKPEHKDQTDPGDLDLDLHL